MRSAEDVRNDIDRTDRAIRTLEGQRRLLREHLGRLLAEARDHPDLTLEEGRQVPEKTISRTMANRLIREAPAE